MPQGLEWAQMSHLLDFIAHNKFNALRVPLSVSSVLDDNKMPDTFGGSVLQNNPRLHNLHYMHVLHVLISEAAARNLLVLLDLHRLTAGDRDNPLWYDSRVSEQMLVGAWGRLAARHCDNWNVVGAECVRKARNNRPHGPGPAALRRFWLRLERDRVTPMQPLQRAMGGSVGWELDCGGLGRCRRAHCSGR